MPSYSGVWTLSQQFQGRGQGLWPQLPGAPTIGTATVASATSASVPFTAPACAGVPATITGYTATSTPGCVTGTAASSPITVSGLTTGTAYTFKVKAQNGAGFGACSAASNSVTPAVVGQQAYTTAGDFSYVVPAGVTSISVVTVGGGGGGGGTNCTQSRGGGGGGALAYVNNISTTPGETLSVRVGIAGAGGPNVANGCNGGFSRLQRGATCLVSAGGGNGGNLTRFLPTPGGTVLNGTGGAGGEGGTASASAGTGGGGAGGYSGAGGAGNSCACNGGSAAACSGGGGGGASGNISAYGGGGGGGVGILGKGTTGTGGIYIGGGGVGGSGGANGYAAPNGLDRGGAGGAYGGGGGGANDDGAAGADGGGGAVRIIWPGTSRSFPSTNTGNL